MITEDTKEIDSILADELGKIAFLCERMNAIVRNVTQPPEVAWLAALTETGTLLHTALGSVLGIKPGMPVEEAISFVCDQMERTFERLGAWKERGCEGEI